MSGPAAVASAAIVIGLVIFGAVLVIVPATDRTSVFVDVASAAISVISVAVLSVIVAELVRQRDDKKAKEAAELEARRSIRTRIVKAYSSSKAIRSALRASGLRPDSGLALSEGMLVTLDEQLNALVAVRIELDQLMRDVADQGAGFETPDHLANPLEAIEKYFKRVIRDWESGRSTLTPTTQASELGRWIHFADFVAAHDAARLPDNPHESYKALERAVSDQLRVAG